MAFLYAGAAIAIVALGFLAWRYTSVARGARRRDAQILPLLDPLASKLEQGEAPTALEIEGVANCPQARPLLHQMLLHFNRIDLFPPQFMKPEQRAEAELTYWLMHPNELQAAPAEMELVETVSRQLEGKHGDFFVYRYRMADGHWAAAKGWLLGVAGPFFVDDVPERVFAGAFSRCGDRHGEVRPSELVEWFIETC